MGLGLGLDVGGTQSRWALADSHGNVLADGTAGSFNGQQIHTAAGREHIARQLDELHQAIRLLRGASALSVWAGVTGHDGAGGWGRTPEAPPHGGPALADHLAHCLGGASVVVRLFNDVELAHRVSLDPGAGYLVYSGTGCIATYVDERGALHRVGGRGETLGDDGSGYWIGSQALRLIWRAEDEQPGFVERSALARALFDAVGGPQWEDTRRFMEVSSRGDVGRLALTVAAVAEQDAMAEGILQRAGQELARLARLLIERHGQRPVCVTGRASALHPVLQSAFEHALPMGTVVDRRTLRVHVDAAVKAARESIRLA